MDKVNGFLLIADISGFTEFIKIHNMRKKPIVGNKLASYWESHAEIIIKDLLETIINSLEPIMKLNKIEGDAAFFYLQSSKPKDDALNILSFMKLANDNFKDKLSKIDKEFSLFINNLNKDRRYLVSCEGAFSYLTNDYGLEEVYLWPVNAESQITPKRMTRTISLVKEKNVPSVFCESTVSNESQMVVANETGANFGGNLFVDSLSDDSGPASTYIKMLEHNLDLIKKGLF